MSPSQLRLDHSRTPFDASRTLALLAVCRSMAESIDAKSLTWLISLAEEETRQQAASHKA
jgi:hypothetical protein